MSVQKHTGWFGRVFGAGDVGGNHTAIVGTGFDVARAPILAKRIGVPDTGFVTVLRDGYVAMRTYSPYEELAQCFQTSLAVLSALDVHDGEVWTVKHESGDALLIARQGTMTWAVLPHEARPVLEPLRIPLSIPGIGTATILRQARSRLHIRLDDLDDVDRVDLTPGQVLGLCADHQVSGVVVSSPVIDGEVRVRAFTSSLGGAEDSATGGAVTGVGVLESVDGIIGDVIATQGPNDPTRQGRLGLRLRGAYDVDLGGEVRTILEGDISEGE